MRIACSVAYHPSLRINESQEKEELCTAKTTATYLPALPQFLNRSRARNPGQSCTCIAPIFVSNFTIRHSSTCRRKQSSARVGIQNLKLCIPISHDSQELLLEGTLPDAGTFNRCQRRRGLPRAPENCSSSDAPYAHLKHPIYCNWISGRLRFEDQLCKKTSKFC